MAMPTKMKKEVQELKEESAAEIWKLKDTIDALQNALEFLKDLDHRVENAGKARLCFLQLDPKPSSTENHWWSRKESTEKVRKMNGFRTLIGRKGRKKRTFQGALKKVPVTNITKVVHHSDGSCETSVSNGCKMVVQPDGTKEFAFTDGTKERFFHGGVFNFTDQNGSKVLKREVSCADGCKLPLCSHSSEEFSNWNGLKMVLNRESGAYRVTYPDGSKHVVHPDSTKEFVTEDVVKMFVCPNCLREVPDLGVMKEKIDLDGIRRTFFTDESEEPVSSGETDDSKSMRDMPIPEETHSGGSKVLLYPDGLKEVTKKDGSKIFFLPDGFRAVECLGIAKDPVLPDGFKKVVKPDSSKVLVILDGSNGTTSNSEGSRVVTNLDGLTEEFILERSSLLVDPKELKEVWYMSGMMVLKHEANSWHFTEPDGSEGMVRLGKTSKFCCPDCLAVGEDEDGNTTLMRQNSMHAEFKILKVKEKGNLVDLRQIALNWNEMFAEDDGQKA